VRRLSPSAVFLDAGGVLVLPSGDLVATALARVGTEVQARAVAPAHYRAIRALDRGPLYSGAASYQTALCRALGVPSAQQDAAVAALAHLADRRASGEIMWSEPAPGALETLDALRRSGLAVLVVTNSDGHGEENLRDAEICQVGLGPGAPVSAVIDSTRVGSTKPDPGIFRMALERAGVAPAAAVHVGDMLSTDVAGATAVGIPAVHLDPTRQCRDPSHRHVRALPGLWRHFALARATRHNTSSL
jgi:putative hydrolase of the HAD superfamily